MMQEKNRDKGVYTFLAQRILLEVDQRKKKEILLFWADLVVGDFERGNIVAGLDSYDKTYVRAAVEKWFYSTLLNMVLCMADAGKDPEQACTEIKKIVLSRTRNIIKDLLFERKASQKNEASGQKGKDKKEKEVDGSFHCRPQSRVGIRVSHLNPEIQDTVFMDPFSDAETQYMFQEMLLEQKTRQEQMTGWHSNGALNQEADDDIGIFVLRQAHLQTLRTRLANSSRLEHKEG